MDRPRWLALARAVMPSGSRDWVQTVGVSIDGGASLGSSLAKAGLSHAMHVPHESFGARSERKAPQHQIGFVIMLEFTEGESA